MNKQELIQHLADALDEINEVERHVMGSLEGGLSHAKTAIQSAKEIAEQLPDTPAMAWQGEPYEHGWYWIEGGGPRYAWADKAGTWWLKGAGGDRRLNGRRVCPIPAPPALPKRGDA